MSHIAEIAPSPSVAPIDRRSDGPFLKFSKEVFDRQFNRRNFEFEHALTGHPLLELPRLIELASETARTRPANLYYDAGVNDLNERWGNSPCDLPVDETIRRIETSDAWIILKYAEHDPAYAKLMESCMRDVLQVGGRELEKHMRRKEVIIFITSPRRLTTYHFDSECNFLLQVQGKKEINIFRSDDREVLPEEELERFWTVDSNAGVYKPHLQDHAEVITLEPGKGVHIPINAPHWLRNGDNISVSVSINYHPWESERGHIYCTNYHLRKYLRINPTPPFQSALLDTIKRPIGAAIARVRKSLYGPVGNR